MNVELLKKSFDKSSTKRYKTVYDKFLAVGEKGTSNNALVAAASRNCEFSLGRLSCGVGVKKYYLPYLSPLFLVSDFFAFSISIPF